MPAGDAGELPGGGPPGVSRAALLRAVPVGTGAARGRPAPRTTDRAAAARGAAAFGQAAGELRAAPAAAQGAAASGGALGRRLPFAAGERARLLAAPQWGQPPSPRAVPPAC